MKSPTRLRVVVHIGPKKTGTTALAASLSKSARKGVLAPDFVYPIGDLWWPEGGKVVKHHSLTSVGLVVDDGADTNSREVNKRALASERLNNLARVLRERGAESVSVFFIAEGAVHRADPVLLTQELLKHFDEVVYCVVARGQVNGIVSSQSHAIRKAGVARQPSSPHQSVNMEQVSERRFDYARVVSRWGQLEDARLVVVPFLESDIATYALFDRLLEAACLPAPPRERNVEGKRVHPALAESALRELHALRVLHQVLGWVPGFGSPILRRFARVKLRAQRQSREMDSRVKRLRLSARKAQRIRLAFAASNEQLRTYLGDASSEPAWAEWFAAQTPGRWRWGGERAQKRLFS